MVQHAKSQKPGEIKLFAQEIIAATFVMRTEMLVGGLWNLKPNPSWTTGAKRASLTEGLHEAFAAVARRKVDAVALISETIRMSYETLNRIADSWASALVDAGLGRHDYVPILIPRSVELVAAILAVLKTGAVYAILDPTWPDRRLQEFLDLLKPPLIITGDDNRNRYSLPIWRPPRSEIAPRSTFGPAKVDGSDPCCIFFTSGTTGRPNGVLSTHRATARLFQQRSFARFADDTIMPLAAPTCWDAFSLELWSVLLNGGTSVIVSDPYISPSALRCGVAENSVNTAWLTSSLFNMIVDEDPDAFAGLKQLLIGGERLSVSHVRRFLNRFPKTHLLNGYGPVESTVFATTHTVSLVDCDNPTGIPLGRPVPCTQVFVLDRSRTCAVGEIGEICIGGDGLALEYLGNTQLTSARFENVRVGRNVHRVYRTGDLGYWSQDGVLNFSGRADRQLKIQGHRIEPAEIERQIELLLPDVQTCRVLPRLNDERQPTDLIAFCKPVTRGNRLHGVLEVLKSDLISYQTPTIVVSVDGFPLTATGKLDEQALLALVPTADTSGKAKCALPEHTVDSTVCEIAKIFKDVIGANEFHLHKTFFENGGTSLAAGRACARVASRLGRNVPLSWLYQFPTAHSLAEHLDRPSSQVERLTTGSGPIEIPLTPMQLAFLLTHLVDSKDRTAHCILLWILEGELTIGALQSAVAHVHQRHEALRSVYMLDPRPRARVVDVPPAFHVLEACSSVEQGMHALRQVLTHELQITRGQVWRSFLAPIRPGNVTLFGCTIHHIAFDAGSESILAKELSESYNALVKSNRLPCRRPMSMLETSNARAAYLARVDLTAQRHYHVAELSGVPDLQWPGKATAPVGARQCVFNLGPQLVACIDGLAREVGVTRFIILLAYYARALAHVTGQRDFAIGVPIRQRHDGASAQSIGCHIDMTCLRFRGDALTDGIESLASAARIALGAFARQDIGWPDILSCLRPIRTDRPPVFQTLFALQDDALPMLTFDGLRTTFVRQPYEDLPLELHSEWWPTDDGGLRLDVSYRPDAIADCDAQSVARCYLASLREIQSLGVH